MSLHSLKVERPQHLLALTALLVTWGLVHVALVAFRGVPALDGSLVDPDSYMRLVRVGELVRDWHWFDGTIARANAPYGDTLHWTRPFDVLILLFALPASYAMDMERALYVAGFLVSPVLQLATALLLIWALRPVIQRDARFLPAVALFLQPGALAYSLLGRADHHALLLLVFVAVAGFMLRGLHNARDGRAPFIAGAFAAFGVWISVEFLLVAAICLTTLSLAWLIGERDRASQGKWFAFGLSAVILLALFVERPIDSLLVASYDRVSSVYYLVSVAILVFWRTAETLEGRRGPGLHLAGRAALGTVGAVAVALVIAAVYPLFYAGPMAEVDPRIVPIWLDRVLEMRPLVPDDRHSLGTFVIFLGGVIVAIPLFVVALMSERGSPRFFPYLFIGVALILLTLVALRHMRFSSYAELAFVMAFAVLFDRFLRWTGTIDTDLLRGFLRGSFISILVVGPLVVGNTLMARPTNHTDAAGQSLSGCDAGAVAAYLESDPRWRMAPQTILAFMDIGPELLYRTRHRVIGTPYHRNGDGIFDGHRMLATGDLAEARALAEQRRVDLILLCQSSAERAFYAAAEGEENLYALLDRGTPPGWLSAVELPPTLRDTARLYQVVR
jgi:hypothetical protein